MKPIKNSINNEKTLTSKTKSNNILAKKMQMTHDQYRTENGLKENKNTLYENGNSNLNIRTNLTNTKSNNHENNLLSTKIRSIITKQKLKLKKLQKEKLLIVETLLKKTLKEQNSSCKLAIKNFNKRHQPPENQDIENLNDTDKHEKIPTAFNTMGPIKNYKNTSILNRKSIQMNPKINEKNTIFNKNFNQNSLSRSSTNIHDLIKYKNQNDDKGKYIFLDNKCTETKNVTCSIIKTEKTIAVLEGSELQPKETIYIKEKPIKEVINNKNGTKTHITKNMFVKITTENKKIKNLKSNKNSPKVILVKQYITKEYNNVITTSNDIPKNNNSLNKKISEDDLIKLYKRNTGKKFLASINVNNINNCNNNNNNHKKINTDCHKKYTDHLDEKKVTKSHLIHVKKDSKLNKHNSYNGQTPSLNSNSSCVKSNKTSIKSTIKNNSNKKNKKIIKKNKNINKKNFLTPKTSNGEINKKNKINFDMPEDIDLKKIEEEEEEETLIKKPKKEKQNTNILNNDLYKSLQVEKNANLMYFRGTKSVEEKKIAESEESNTKSKINKLDDFLSKLNDSSEENYESGDLEKVFNKVNKNSEKNNFISSIKCVLENEEIEVPFQFNSNSEIKNNNSLDRIKDVPIKFFNNESLNSEYINENKIDAKMYKMETNLDNKNNTSIDGFFGDQDEYYDERKKETVLEKKNIKFYAPLGNYRGGFELNKKNPFNDDSEINIID